MRGKHITAFYMEMLVLVAVFTGMIVILSQVFVTAKEQSAQARVLTDAVCLAENAAELAAVSGSWEGFLALLKENGAAWEENGRLCARYDNDMDPDPKGPFRVDVQWIQQEGLGGALVQVYWQDGPQPVYQLETAVYRGEAGR